MSRIGRQPVVIPAGITVSVEDGVLRAEGPKGRLERRLPPGVQAAVAAGAVVVSRQSDQRSVRALHGLTRALVANMVTGVTSGFERRLEIIGIGYRAQLQGRNLQLALGYSHPLVFPLPEGVAAEVDGKQTAIVLRGADKELVGQTAANLRDLRRPDPYKGKGIRYAGEVVRRKVGKKAGAK